MLLNILLFTIFASILSLFIVAMLLISKTAIKKISFSLVAFAAGALLATAFLETLRESVELLGDSAYYWVTFSIVFFFIVERVFIFIHHHEEEEEGLKIPIPALLFGDTLHNFIDGASIAAAFLISFPLGVITSLAVFIHEIPHELGDFGILLHKGWKRKKVLLFNFLTGISAIAGALITYYLGKGFENIVSILLAITTGNFIYLAAVDLLPEVHHKAKRKLAAKHSMFFLLGVLIVALLVRYLG